MKSYLVLGLGRFGRSFAKTLIELGHEVLGVDNDERIVQEFSRDLTHTVQAEACSEDFLRSIDVKSFDAAVVAIGDNIQSSIMATVLLKELGCRFILTKAQDDLQAKVLYKVGADKVVFPERDMGIKAAHNLVTNNFFDMIEISQDHSIIGLSAPHNWVGKTIGDLAVRARYGVNILAVKNSSHTSVSPQADTIIHADDILTIMGANSDLKKLQNIK